MLLTFFVIYLIIGAIVAHIAKLKGRKELLWFTYGFCIPLIAIIHVILIKKIKQCQICSESVLFDAKICKYCHSNLE